MLTLRRSASAVGGAGLGEPPRPQETGVAAAARAPSRRRVVAGSGLRPVSRPRARASADDPGLRHPKERRADRGPAALHARLRSELADLLEGTEERRAAVGIAGGVEGVRADDDLSGARRFRDGEGEREKERVAGGHIRHGDRGLSERPFRDGEPVVCQRRASERSEAGNPEDAVRGHAVSPGEPPRRRELHPVPLPVVERDRVDPPAPVREKREAGSAVEPPREEQNGRLPSRRRRPRDPDGTGPAAHRPATSPQRSLWIWRLSRSLRPESRTHSATSAAIAERSPWKTGEIRTDPFASRS